MKNVSLTDDEFSFLRDAFTKHMNIADLNKEGVPLTPHGHLASKNNGLSMPKHLWDHFAQEISKRGLKSHEILEAVHYGVGIPEEDMKVAVHLKNYAEHIASFLASRLERCNFQINWHIVKPGEDFSGSNIGLGFIVNRFYEVYSIKASAESGERLASDYVIQKIGGKLLRNTAGGRIYSRNLLVTADKDGLISPVSEMLHYSIPEGIRSKGYDPIWEEALVEASAPFLVKEFFKNSALSDKVDGIVRADAESMKNIPQYVKIPLAIKWIMAQGKDGIQKAFDLYMENPQKFMQAIQAYSSVLVRK